MNFDKFKKKTNSFKMISKCKRLDFTELFKVLKVIEVVNYYTVEAVIYNAKSFHKVIFLLNDVDVFDDKLSIHQQDKMKEQLRKLTLNQYFNFELDDIFYQNNKNIFNLKFVGKLTLHEEETTSSINTLMVNSLINIFVLRDKIRQINRQEGAHFKSRIKNLDIKDTKKIYDTLEEEKLVRHVPLSPIPEELGRETEI